MTVVRLLQELVVSVVDINRHTLRRLSEWIRGICLPWPGQILWQLIFNHIKGVIVFVFVHHGRSMIPKMSRWCSATHHHIFLFLSRLQLLLALELAHESLHSVFDRRGTLSHFLIRGGLLQIVVLLLLIKIGDVMASDCCVTIFWGHAWSMRTSGRLGNNSLVRLLLRIRSLKISLLLLWGRG